MPAHRKNYDDAVRLYQSGLSVRDVAVAFGISHQAMHKILMRRTELREKLRFGKENHFHRGGETRNANFTVTKAIRRGILTVGPCEVCGLEPAIVKGRQRIHGHHDDYNFLLKVRWLCRKDHDDWHKKNRAIPRSEDNPMMSRKEIGRLGGLASQAKKR